MPPADYGSGVDHGTTRGSLVSYAHASTSPDVALVDRMAFTGDERTGPQTAQLVVDSVIGARQSSVFQLEGTSNEQTDTANFPGVYHEAKSLSRIEIRQRSAEMGGMTSYASPFAFPEDESTMSTSS